ncbi:unnamed protein product [Ambrosiozyma monospora]|uniref:Unnamed protein product n=1 Tax=Ambrosiozyma monospora TaxID=43982 RepID=A0ACB5TQC4_AMBMO|nr:unnamed protein product [Ambrosiozyma monospora]
MLQITDRTSSTQTYAVEERMKILRRNFLSGFEDKAIQDFDSFKAGNNEIPLTYKLKIDTKQLKETPRERTFQLPNGKQKRNIGSPDIHLFYVGKNDLKFKFNFISSLRPTSIEDLNSSPAAAVLLCRALTTDKIYAKEFDYTTEETTKYVQLECIDICDDVHMIPRSYSDTTTARSSSIFDEEEPFYALQLGSEILSKFDTVVIAESSDDVSGNDFILSDLELEQSSSLVLGEPSLWKLFTRGYYITLPGHRPVIVDIQVPSAWSSLLAYKFDIRYEHSKTSRFSPIIHQLARDEVKWHINIEKHNDVTALIQGVSPFCPFVRDNDPYIHLKLFSDSLSSDQIMDIYMTVDWFKSLKMLVLKYRLSVIGFPTFVTVLVMYLQFRSYIKTGLFPTFGESLAMFCDIKVIGPISVILAFLSSFASHSLFQKLLTRADPVPMANLDLMQDVESSEVHVNMYFMGLEEGALWFYGPLVMIASLSLVSAFYFIVSQLVNFFSFLVIRLAPVKTGRPNIHGKRRCGCCQIFCLILT